MVMHISCTKVCACHCISHSFALGGKYGISLMVHGTMCRRMFGPLLMTHEMIVMKMMKTFVLCVVTNAPPQFVGSAMRGIALSVLTLTLVGMKLCMLDRNFALFLYIHDLPMFPIHPILFPWNTALGKHYGCGITMHERFLVHMQLCFVVSFA